MVIMAKPAGKVEEALIREGWKTLVKKMGVAKATRFLVAFERGEGDSVREIKRSGVASHCMKFIAWSNVKR